MIIKDDGYYWLEVTGPTDLPNRRVFARGAAIEPDVEPWTIRNSGGELAVWIDDRNQEHFIPVGDPLTPTGWRRLYVEKGKR